MGTRGQKLIIGQRLKVLRKTLGLTQAQMAEHLEVSPSYITLVEADQRPASAKLLMKLAQVYDMNISELAPDINVQLATDFETALKDPSLELSAIPRSEIEAVLHASPRIAAAMVRLQGKYTTSVLRNQGSNNLLTDRNKVEVLGEIARPVEQIRDWFYDHKNYIDKIDRAAERLGDVMGLRRGEPHIALSERLSSHGIRVRILSADIMDGSLRRYDPHNKSLMLSELLGQESRRFQIGVMIGLLEYREMFDEIIAKAGFDDSATQSLAKISLANYFSAALSMPYERFLAACEKERYDIELISHRFGVSFEQAAHRMSTLQRPRAHGIPFFFVRIDRAGNVSKRFSAGRFPFSRFGGTCPLWNIHSAFEKAEQIHTQVIRMPEGAKYFSIVRTVTRAGGTYEKPAQKLAIGLGCDVNYAPRLIYADRIDLDKTEPTDIGLNCFLCERANCTSRAQAPINRKITINERERSLALFRFEGE